MFRPGHVRDRRRPRDRGGLSRRARSARRCASRSATGPSSASSTPARTAFDSEIWGDAEQMMQAFRRARRTPSMHLAPRRRRCASTACKHAIEGDQRLHARGEARVAGSTTTSRSSLSKFISYLGTTISIIFSIGAIIGAMITMYASVASRTGEIGTLRALGFSRGAILAAFLVEALLLGLVGGVVGLVGARRSCRRCTISTMNFQTFAELAFSFTLTPAIVLTSLAFALAHGLRRRLPAGVRARRGSRSSTRCARPDRCATPTLDALRAHAIARNTVRRRPTCTPRLAHWASCSSIRYGRRRAPRT